MLYACHMLQVLDCERYPCECLLLMKFGFKSAHVMKYLMVSQLHVPHATSNSLIWWHKLQTPQGYYVGVSCAEICKLNWYLVKKSLLSHWLDWTSITKFKGNFLPQKWISQCMHSTNQQILWNKISDLIPNTSNSTYILYYWIGLRIVYDLQLQITKSSFSKSNSKERRRFYTTTI